MLKVLLVGSVKTSERVLPTAVLLRSCTATVLVHGAREKARSAGLDSWACLDWGYELIFDIVVFLFVFDNFCLIMV